MPLRVQSAGVANGQHSTLTFALPPSLGEGPVRELALRFADVLFAAGFATVIPMKSYELLERAFRVSGEPTKKAAVTRALQEFIARREQRRPGFAAA